MDYTQYLIAEDQNRPKFLKTIRADTDFYIYLKALAESFLEVNTNINEAEGVWLSYLGSLVGAERNLREPINGVTTLDDEMFLFLIKLKIASNKWDGTIEDAYSIWKILFDDIEIIIQDNQDMTQSLILINFDEDGFKEQLLIQNKELLKPQSVNLKEVLIGDGNLIFAWDLPNGLVYGGWDTARWARPI